MGNYSEITVHIVSVGFTGVGSVLLQHPIVIVFASIPWIHLTQSEIGCISCSLVKVSI